MIRDDGDFKHRRGRVAKRTMFVIHGIAVILCSIHITKKITSHFIELFKVGDLCYMGRFQSNVECFYVVDKEIRERYGNMFA